MNFETLSLVALKVILSGIACALVHEGAHWLAAKMFGRTIKFEFTWGKIAGYSIVPRWTWKHPEGLDMWKLAVICYAGFTVEIIVGLIAALVFKFPYLLGAGLAHLCAYPSYAGDASDFKF